MDVNNAVSQIKKRKIVIDNLFIFTDDFRYVGEIREKCPEWNIYTLTGENERGYNNTRFNNLTWALKRRELIKLFAMVEICLNSEIHFGCEVASVNDYIKNLKLPSGYIPIWTEKDAHIRKEIICDYRNIY